MASVSKLFAVQLCPTEALNISFTPLKIYFKKKPALYISHIINTFIILLIFVQLLLETR